MADRVAGVRLKTAKKEAAAGSLLVCLVIVPQPRQSDPGSRPGWSLRRRRSGCAGHPWSQSASHPAVCGKTPGAPWCRTDPPGSPAGRPPRSRRCRC